MIPISTSGQSFQLVPFERKHALTIARWVTTREQLRLLAPSESFPLLTARVANWVKPGGRALMMIDKNVSANASVIQSRDREGAVLPSPLPYGRGSDCASRPRSKTHPAPIPLRALPLGYGELNPMGGKWDHLWIGHVIVDPQHRGKGLGNTLVSLLVEQAFRRLKFKRISLVVFPENVAAIRCYRRAGFVFAGEERHRFNDTGPLHRLFRFERKRDDSRARLTPPGYDLNEVIAK